MDFVELHEAFEIVLDLARQNVIEDDDMEDERNRQLQAISTIEDYVVNHLGDD